MHSPYRIQFSEKAESVKRIASIFSRNGNPKCEKNLSWQYLKNPAGGHITAFAVTADGKDAAVYSVFFAPFLQNGQHILAAQSLDTLTDKDHRGQGLFTLLADAVYHRCEEKNIQFVYGFPNSQSGPGFFGKLGWKDLGAPPFIFRVFNMGYLINRLSRGIFKAALLIPFPRMHLSNRINIDREIFSILPLERFDTTYDQLWQNSNSRNRITIDRTSEYMNWRYIDCPRKDYKIISVSKGGVLEAVCVSTIREKHGGKIGYIMDVIHARDNLIAANIALQSTLRSMKDGNVDIALAWCASSAKSFEVYRNHGFFKLPRAMQPIKLFFGVRYTSQKHDSSVKSSDFFLSYADSDTV